MRVLLTTDVVGGVWDHTVALARELDAAGHEVLVAVIGHARDETLAALPVGVQSTFRTYRLEWMPDCAADLRAAGEWLRDLAALWAADVVHLNQMAYAAAGIAAPVVTAVHSDVLSWWRCVHGREAPATEWGAYAAAVRAGLLASDAVVAPTRFQAEQAERSFGVRVDRVIHNGIAAPARVPAPPAAALVVSVGRAWDRAKGMDLLDDAAGLLGAGAPEVHVLGETAAPHGERWQARHARAHGRVERAAVDRWLRRASVYVGASRYEPFGLAPLEAALAGCALVLSDIGAFRELWDGCAEFFPAGDAAALAECLRRVCADPARRALLAGAAATRARRRYAAARMAGEYAALYRELAGRAADSRKRATA